jgi:hypothetical protein
MHLGVHRFYAPGLHHHLFAVKLTRPNRVSAAARASWPLTANEALVAALEAALAEEGVRPRDNSR